MKYIKNKLNKWIDNKFNKLIYSQRSEYLTNCALNSNEPGISNDKYCNNKIIVSLTTFNKRLYEVYLTIESIMQQTLKPNKIILWISDEINVSDIPLILKRQQNRGLEIKFYKDILSYKKLIPTLKTFPSDIIITIDDDCIYYFDLIENLFNAYIKNPKLISSAKIRRMKLKDPNTFEKYKKWNLINSNFEISPFNFPTGSGGILYPPNCFTDEVFNENIFLNICKYADDIWFKAMALLNDTLSQKIYTHNIKGDDYITNNNVQSISLKMINIGKGMNDIQLKTVFDKYNLYEKLYK